MTPHTGRVAGLDCPTCGPLVVAAQVAYAASTRAQQTDRRSSRRYLAARRHAREASSALLAAKCAHYARG